MPRTSLTPLRAAAIEAVLRTRKASIFQVTAGSTGSLFGAGGGTNASSSQATFAITTDPTPTRTDHGRGVPPRS
jgi:hypothetical protein